MAGRAGAGGASAREGVANLLDWGDRVPEPGRTGRGLTALWLAVLSGTCPSSDCLGGSSGAITEQIHRNALSGRNEAKN